MRATAGFLALALVAPASSTFAAEAPTTTVTMDAGRTGTATGLVLQLYRERFGSIPVEVEGEFRVPLPSSETRPSSTVPP